MRQIPTSLLPSTMTVNVPSDGGYAGKFAEGVEISHVRFDRTAALIRSGVVLTDGAAGLIYVDAVNSEGAFAIPEGSMVTIDGDKLMVNRVITCNDFNGHVHHWEVEVL